VAATNAEISITNTHYTVGYNM